jgi:hypothetical protein
MSSFNLLTLPLFFLTILMTSAAEPKHILKQTGLIQQQCSIQIPVPWLHGVNAIDQREETCIIQTIENEQDRFRLHYVMAKTPLLSAIELQDHESGKTLGFRYRYLTQGEERWTSWTPPHLQSNARTLWTQELILKSRRLIEQDFQRQNKKFNLLLTDLPKDDPLSFEPGEQSWSYNPVNIKIWSGYLWDFKNGWMFRGYRKSKIENEILTPSQNQTSSELAAIKNYYSKVPEKIMEAYDVQSSRWLSPLDKWGFWANRRLDQSWWIASAWEGLYHHTNVTWGGYCNASTVLPFLWKKPAHRIEDLGLIFDPRDLVALMQVASYKVDYLFWGARYNGAFGETQEDPSPEFVIDLLRHYLGQNGVPLIMDHEAGPAIGNVLALAARVKIVATDDPLVRSGTLFIDNVGNMEDDLAVGTKEDEALVPDWSWGTNTKKYDFKILLNPDGSLKSTAWDKSDFHPDFFWLPTGNRDYPAPYQKNPHLPLKYVQELVEKSY